MKINLNEQIARMQVLMGIQNIVNESVEISELSDSTMHNAIKKASNRGQDQRVADFSKHMFKDFIGMPLMGGQIADFDVHHDTGNDTVDGNDLDYLVITYVYANENPNGEPKKGYVSYDITNKKWGEDLGTLDRREARTLTQIAQKVSDFDGNKDNFKIRGVHGGKSAGTLKELSDETMISAVKSAERRGQSHRSGEFGNHMFRNFVDMSFLGGKITKIDFVHGDNPEDNTDEFNYLNIFVDVNGKNHTLQYAIEQDEWHNLPDFVSRRDARIISVISGKVNPQSKYSRNVADHVRIQGVHRA